MNPNFISPFKNAMIIDRSETGRFIAETLIKETGFAEEVISVQTAHGGISYLQKHAHQPELLPQIIFLDIKTTEAEDFDFLSGYECLPESIKKDGSIIALSTCFDSDELEHAQTNKRLKWILNKPLDSADLVRLKLEFDSKSRAIAHAYLPDKPIFGASVRKTSQV